jgi:hypothetical protein
VQGAVFLLECLAQPVKIGLIVFFAKEAGFAVMPALDDVERDIVEVDAGAAGHEAILAK